MIALLRNRRLIASVILIAAPAVLWLFRLYQAYKVASKLPTPSIYELGIIALGMVLLLSLAWTESWTAKLTHYYREAKGLKTILEISGPHLLPDHVGHNRWRFRVHNRGPATADNVQMRLKDIDPHPKYGRWQADYPYPVERVGKKLNEPPSRINSGDEEDYEVRTWLGSDGNCYASLDTKDIGPLYMVAIERCEDWELKYELTAENADRVRFSMQMSVKDGAVLVERKG